MYTYSYYSLPIKNIHSLEDISIFEIKSRQGLNVDDQNEINIKHEEKKIILMRYFSMEVNEDRHLKDMAKELT